MLNKLIFCGLFLTQNVFALDALSLAKQHVITHHFNNQTRPLIASEEKVIPFKSTQIFRINASLPSSRGWVVWVNEQGESGEFDQSHLKALLHSLKVPLKSLNFSQATLEEARKVSMGLLFYLGTSKREIDCKMLTKGSAECRLGFSHGPHKLERALIEYRFNESRAVIK